ncbi:MAG: 2-keto-4-pentenoate hydratase, partial [Rickettsiales bacterium]|nr:2-keto-4-pentenoate hydratase [Rickettsiales bacterium]
MKLASLKEGGRDGTLVVVSKNLQRAVRVPSVARTMQQALDSWETIAPELENIYTALNEGAVADAFELDMAALASPLPRAYQWIDGSAYVNHVELVRKARGAEMPESFWTDPLMYQGGSDAFIGPRDDIPVQDTSWGIDFEAEIAVITDDVPMGIEAADVASHIKLIMLVNDVSLRNLIPGELGKGFGFFQSKPASSFSPVAVTPDELGDAWHDSKVHLPLLSTLNDTQLGHPDAGEDMTFDFSQLIAHAAKTRYLTAGTILGSGTISNKQEGVGSSCLAEIRMLEKINEGEMKTPFMQFGDRIRIEMKDKDGNDIFGAIDQEVVQ